MRSFSTLNVRHYALSIWSLVAVFRQLRSISHTLSAECHGHKTRGKHFSKEGEDARPRSAQAASTRATRE